MSDPTSADLVASRSDRPPAVDDERETLMTMLRYTRATVHAKCTGLADEHVGAVRLPTSPLTTIGGLVSHVRWVEYSWVQVVFLGEEDHGPWTEEDPDRELRIGAALPLDELLASYAEQSARYDELLAGHDLAELSVRPGSDGRRFPLRWILLHLIEETARHNGHLDILREMADGVTGD